MTRQRKRQDASLWERLEQTAEGRSFLGTIEGWLALQPDAERAELHQALRGRDEAFYGAELELFLGDYFHEQGWNFDRHPDLGNGKRPDYLVHSRDPPAEFILEARASVDSVEVQCNRAMEQLRDALDGIEGHEWVQLTIEGNLPGDLSIRKAVSGVRDFVDAFRAGGTNRSVVYTKTGCSLKVEVLADDVELGPVVGSWRFGEDAENIDNAQPLLDAFRRKASRYGPMDRPYVVALFGRRRFPLSAHSVTSALYGTRQWNFDDSEEALRFVDESTKRDGAFTSLKDGEPIHTRVSAAAVYVRRDPGTGMEYHLAVIHNPFAAIPLPRELFVGCPQFIAVEPSADGDISMRWDGDPPTWG